MIEIVIWFVIHKCIHTKIHNLTPLHLIPVHAKPASKFATVNLYWYSSPAYYSSLNSSNCCHFCFSGCPIATTFVASKEKLNDNNINHSKTQKFLNHNKVCTQQSAQFFYWLDEWSEIDFGNPSHVEKLYESHGLPFSLIACLQKATDEQLKHHKDKVHLHYLL